MREKCCVNDPHIWKWDWLLISKVVRFGTGMPVDRWCKIQNLRKNALNSGRGKRGQMSHKKEAHDGQPLTGTEDSF